ncbi:MAG: hypothetical protein NVSMB63_11570 [Sediminibacterium sp.]
MGKDLTKVQHIVFICNGNSCLGKGSDDTTLQIRNAITAQDMHEAIHTIRTRCTGQCEHGPMVFVTPEATWYKEMKPEVSERLVQQHLVEKQLLEEHLFFKPAE